MIEIVGRGAVSKRPFTYQLHFEQQAVQLRAVHENGIPTAVAVFPRQEFDAFIPAALALSTSSEPITLVGRRASGGNCISLRVRRVNADSIRMALLDASEVTVSSTDFRRDDWMRWSVPAPAPSTQVRTA